MKFSMCILMLLASCTTTTGDVGEGEGEAVVGEGEGEGEEVSYYCLAPEGEGGCDTVEGGDSCPRYIFASEELSCDTPMIHCSWCNYRGFEGTVTSQCGNYTLIEPHNWQQIDSCESDPT